MCARREHGGSVYFLLAPRCVFTVKHERSSMKGEKGGGVHRPLYDVDTTWYPTMGGDRGTFFIFFPLPLAFSLAPFPGCGSNLALKWGYVMGVACYCHIIPIPSRKC